MQTKPPPPTLTTLPSEVIQNILYLLPPASALALERTCSTLLTNTASPLLWRHYCLTSWRKWDRSHDLSSNSSSNSIGDWRSLFAQRARTRKAVQRLVERVVTEDAGRIGRLERIVKLGWDGVETLLEGFEGAVAGCEDELARRWVCRRLLLPLRLFFFSLFLLLLLLLFGFHLFIGRLGADIPSLFSSTQILEPRRIPVRVPGRGRGGAAAAPLPGRGAGFADAVLRRDGSVRATRGEEGGY